MNTTWSPWRLLKSGAKQQNALRWRVHSHTHQHMFHSVCVEQTIDKTFRPIKSVLHLIVDLLLERELQDQSASFSAVCWSSSSKWSSRTQHQNCYVIGMSYDVTSTSPRQSFSGLVEEEKGFLTKHMEWRIGIWSSWCSTAANCELTNDELLRSLPTYYLRL